MGQRLRWFMVSLVGRDRPGIVAGVTQALYAGGCTLGETSMMRLGGNFSIMMMAACPVASAEGLVALLRPQVESLGLHLHVDPIEARLHEHPQPDVRITVYGADRPGIVAQVTTALAAAGFNILDLESDVGGTTEAPIYVLHMEGQALEGVAPLRSALEALRREAGVEVSLSPVEAMIG